MTLSILALTSAVFLFAVATFAWLTVSDIVDIGQTEVQIEDIDATAVLQVSTDGGLNYVDTTTISIENAVPGDVYYYRIVITNTGALALNTRVLFYGFTSSVASIFGDDTNFEAGRTLCTVLLYSMTNTANEETISGQTLASLIGGTPYETGNFIGADNIDIAYATSETVYFTITVPGTVGNDYSNLRLTLDSIHIQSEADEG
ncbi:MAG: hypothetical protein V1761_00190 [bacterium]